MSDHKLLKSIPNLFSKLGHFSKKIISHQSSVVQPPFDDDIPSFYIGTHTFFDEATKRKHLIEITPNLTIRIDDKPLDGNVMQLTNHVLTFLDHYGYHLQIFAEHNLPTKIYDEADNTTYPIIRENNDK